jgi:hypothetical protein
VRHQSVFCGHANAGGTRLSPRLLNRFPAQHYSASASNRLRAPQFKIGALDLNFSIDAAPRPEDQPRLKASATDLDVVITQLRYDCHILPTIRCSDCEVSDVATTRTRRRRKTGPRPSGPWGGSDWIRYSTLQRSACFTQAG